MTKNNNIDEKTLNKGKIIRDFEEEFNNKRLNPLNSNTFNNILRNLSTPRFLGSYHLKEAINPKFKSVERILRGDIQLKYSKSLRNVVFNPITIALIIIALAFNLFWLFIILF
ncbi:MAG: hypothetical protein ACFFBZ_08845 [Promethearchaeota archaeon]